MVSFRRPRGKTNALILFFFVILPVIFIISWKWKNIHRGCQTIQQYIPLTTTFPQKTTLDVTPVYIVEEHHEVLPYWFKSADRGLIPKKGNVLLHIDGHSDGAPPDRFDIISLFKYPKIKDEIRALMQANDVFIAGAAQTGLISRYIWVWPPWETTMSSRGNDHLEFNLLMGLMKGISSDNKLPVCVCFEFIKDIDGWTNNCAHLKKSMRESHTLEELGISKDKCDIKKTTFVEIVSEDKALELTRSDKWLSPLDHIILDIDEDYYGCEAAIITLYDVGMTSQQVDDLSTLTQATFCGGNSTQERHFNNLFYDLIQNVKFVNECRVGTSIDKLAFRLNETKRLSEKLYDTLKNPIFGNSVCKNEKHSLKSIIFTLLKFLCNLSISQLTAISKVGLCLPGSAQTYSFSPDLGMRLCVGFNRPNNTMVIFHTPTMSEIEIRTANMRSLLKNVPAPSVVTVCRSMRDGYTPVKYFSKIEEDVLNTLLNTYEKISFDSIHYDPELLGGKPGLPARHFFAE
ncbi:uncharacterized protein LOC126811699 [Patella vulgata]|uniref:uncharacterized protein LOC126811699 n=1 Tax=Patella vulgata TaxID=6465 RepID=UPI0024A86948|nr:uncharacterized protein LOC126811699 [Patella vulgata]